MQKFLKTTSIMVIATLCTVFGSAVPAAAQTSTTSLPGLFACRSIEDVLERVKCYDKVTDELAVADQKGEIVTITKKQVEEMEKESFGFNLPSIPKLSSLFGKSKHATPEGVETPSKKAKNGVGSTSPQNLISPIKSVQVLNRNLTRFYLENGQVWEQKNGRALRLRIRDDRPIVAHIYRGSISGYRLRVNGKGAMVNVRRVQ